MQQPLWRQNFMSAICCPPPTSNRKFSHQSLLWPKQEIHNHQHLLQSQQLKVALCSTSYFIKLEKHYSYFSSVHISQGELTICAPHFWKQCAKLCKHWFYASFRYPWLHRCKDFLNDILLFASFYASESCYNSKYHGSEPGSTTVYKEMSLIYKSE